MRIRKLTGGRDVAPVQTTVAATPVPSAGDGGEDVRRVSLVTLSVLAFIVGIVTGFGAVLFRDLIGLIHNILFLGRFVVHYDANLFTPTSPWGALVIAIPVIGAVAVTFLVTTFAPEARGHGVPEVMDAIYYMGGVIRPVVAVVKSLASAIAIGSGAAVGREGPIIQIGSALGSTLGQLITMPPGQRIILVAAGSGAGIAATFNTPIGGVMFAIELMMPEVSVRTFLPVALSTGAATFIGRFFFGPQPAFSVPHLLPLTTDATSAVLLVLYGVVGALTGIAAAGFVQGLDFLQTSFDKIKGSYARHALGMLLVGILIYGLHERFGQYYVEGVGYATVQAILLSQVSATPLLLVLFISKLLATTLSLGSGSSGGIFSPSLFMGATVGGAFAAVLSAALVALHLHLAIDIPSFAMVGMGAMVGGATGAAMTAVTMIFEMTRDYNIVLPMIVAVALSVGVRRMLSRENIYTLKLFRRGHVIPKALHANMFLVQRAKEVMDTNVVLLPAAQKFEDFVSEWRGAGQVQQVVVVDDHRIVGVLPANIGMTRLAETTQKAATLGEVASRNFAIVRAEDIVFDVIQRIWRRNAVMAVVTKGRGVPRPEDVVGVVTKEHVADSVASSVRVYPS